MVSLKKEQLCATTFERFLLYKVVAAATRSSIWLGDPLNAEYRWVLWTSDSASSDDTSWYCADVSDVGFSTSLKNEIDCVLTMADGWVLEGYDTIVLAFGLLCCSVKCIKGTKLLLLRCNALYLLFQVFTLPVSFGLM